MPTTCRLQVKWMRKAFRWVFFSFILFLSFWASHFRPICVPFCSFLIPVSGFHFHLLFFFLETLCSWIWVIWLVWFETVASDFEFHRISYVSIMKATHYVPFFRWGRCWDVICFHIGPPYFAVYFIFVSQTVILLHLGDKKKRRRERKAAAVRPQLITVSSAIIRLIGSDVSTQPQGVSTISSSLLFFLFRNCLHSFSSRGVPFPFMAEQWRRPGTANLIWFEKKTKSGSTRR